MNRLCFASLLLLMLFVGESYLARVAPKAVENEQTFPWKRIIYKLDLSSIYPEKPRDMDFNATVVKMSPFKNFKQPITILLDRDKLYFTTNVDRPAVFRVNVFFNPKLISIQNATLNSHQNATLNANHNASQNSTHNATPNSTQNSTQKPTKDLRKFTKVFNIAPAKTQKTHLFELAINGSLEEILNSEKAILSEFETKLWKSAKPCKDCLSIAYIRRGGDEFQVGVASTQKHSDLLNEFCSNGNIPNEYLKIVRLKVDRNFAECKTIDSVNQAQREKYELSVYMDVSTQPHGNAVRGFLRLGFKILGTFLYKAVRDALMQ